MIGTDGDSDDVHLRPHPVMTLHTLKASLVELRGFGPIGELWFKLFGLRPSQRASDLQNCSAVLVVRLDAIGDVVLTSPLLRELRRTLPQAWITLVVQPSVYNLVELCPHVNEVLTFDVNTRGRKHATLIQYWRALKLAATCLWRRRFDLAINPRSGEDSYRGNLLSYLSGARWRVGYSVHLLRDGPLQPDPCFERLLTQPLRDSADQHEVQHNLDTLRAIGCRVESERLELWLSEDDRRFADQLLSDEKMRGPTAILGICLGAGAQHRIWPLSNFAKVAAWFIEHFSGYVVSVGGIKEYRMAELLRQELGSRVINITGTTSLRQTAAVLSCCSVYLGNDAGPLHIATAMKVPVVEISPHPRSGSRTQVNSPVRFGPWGKLSMVLQPDHPLPPCEDCCQSREPHCITQVQVENVQSAIEELLAKRTR